jgi:hypothetical protein
MHVATVTAPTITAADLLRQLPLCRLAVTAVRVTAVNLNCHPHFTNPRIVCSTVSSRVLLLLLLPLALVLTATAISMPLCTAATAAIAAC